MTFISFQLMCVARIFLLSWVTLLWLIFGLNHYPKTPTKSSTLELWVLTRLSLGSDAYVLDLPNNLGIIRIFNVKDLTLHRCTFEPPSLPFGDSASSKVPKLPPFPQPHSNTKVVLNDEFLSSSRGVFRCFLVQWLGRPQSNVTWITVDEFRELNPALLEW